MGCLTPPAYTHQAGDKFIFKGGDTWPDSCAGLSVTAGGAAGAIDYYGVCLNTDPDSPCYGGTSWPSTGWTRPVFDAQYHSQWYGFFRAFGLAYITIDNFEVKNMSIAPGQTYTSGSGCSVMFNNQGDAEEPGTTVENSYFHDWAVTSEAKGLFLGCAAMIVDASEVSHIEMSDAGGYVVYNGVQESGLSWVTGQGVWNANELKNSSLHDMGSGATAVHSVHDNEFYHMEDNATPNNGQHQQIIEDNHPCATGPGMTDERVYNNLIHDSDDGVNIYVRYFSSIYNNVFWNLANNYPIRLCVPGGDSGSFVGNIYNNTAATGSTMTGSTLGTGAPGLGTLNASNNIAVGGGNPTPAISIASTHYSNNYSMSSAEAATYGFTPANLFAPTSSDPNVVNGGSNLSLFCTIIGQALCFDTEGAAWYGGAYQARPTGSTAWALGAYVGAQSAHLNPPTGLIATVQ